MVNHDRRRFLKSLLGKTISVGTKACVLSTVAMSIIPLTYISLSDLGDGEVVTEESKKSVKENERMTLFDREIRGIPFKFHGVRHHKPYAEANFNKINDLVKNASIIVSESSPEDKNKALATKSGKSYFGTTRSLARKYDKEIISLDSRNGVAAHSETLAGLGGMILAYKKSGKIITKDSSRRDFFVNTGLTGLGFYLLRGSFMFGIGHSLPLGLFMDHEEVKDYFITSNNYTFSHQFDQRNVEYANRLLKLTDLLSKDELHRKNGDYVLVETGSFHTHGAVFYLDNPIMRKAKTAAYSFNYGLIDSDEISKFTPLSDGSWKKERLD